MAKGTVEFLLNDEVVLLDNVDPNLTVLQYLREFENKTGTKEGCASGDCGACTVVVAELLNTDNTKIENQLTYKSINACITFIGTLHGKQLITVEHLKQGSQLHTVQQSMVDHHASQCGFCTPGFVMSFFALHKNKSKPNREEVLEALAGNLCRCTGYRSIIDAAMDEKNQCKNDSFAQHYQQTIKQLTRFNELPAAELTFNVASHLAPKNHTYFAPKNCQELSSYLLKNPQSTLVAGGTDLALAVTQQLSFINQLVYLGNVKELNVIEENDGFIRIGSAVPYHQFTSLLAKDYVDLSAMIERIGSLQIRNNGTLGGNIGNASPIGDMPPALIALGCTIDLAVNDQERTVLVENYFVDYKKTILAPSEFIKCINIPKAKVGSVLKVYKISKRIDDDISAVLAAFYIELTNKKVTAIRIAFGGMAAIPKRATACENALLNKTFSQENIILAKQALTQDYQPMSDVRASHTYRMRVAQNLLEKCFIEVTVENAAQSTLDNNLNNKIETRVINYA